MKFLGGRGLLASGSADRTCRLWRAAGEEDAQYECAHVFRWVHWCENGEFYKMGAFVQVRSWASGRVCACVQVSAQVGEQNAWLGWRASSQVHVCGLCVALPTP